MVNEWGHGDKPRVGVGGQTGASWYASVLHSNLKILLKRK